VLFKGGRGNEMRTRPSQDRATSRIVNRYHKLYEPLVELVQSIEDLLPPGLQLDETIELSTEDGVLSVAYKVRPVRLIVHDANNTFTLEVCRSSRKVI
jgi:hypothetical protein